MTVAKQLYQLQEVDLQIESAEKSLREVKARIGDSQEVALARDKLAAQQKRLEEMKGRQHSLEWEIDDLRTKVVEIDRKLYSGSIANPKELSGFQREGEGMNRRRGELEDEALEVMGQVEKAAAEAEAFSNQLKALEDKWRDEQKELSARAESLKKELSQLKESRRQVSLDIDPAALELYQGLRKQKGAAVAKVEQGMCRGCRISLFAGELQRLKSGGLVQCSSCGRIIFLP